MGAKIVQRMPDQRRYFCTYLDVRYIPRFLLMYESLVINCSNLQMWALCFDSECFSRLTLMHLPGVLVISGTDFEAKNPDVAVTKFSRSQIEYYFTCTPALPLHVLLENPAIDIITYVDADFFFLSNIGPYYDELGSGSIALVPHRFPKRLQHLEVHGKYNVGILSFRNDALGMLCLEWWRARCIDWCYDRVEHGKFADQKYLDDWPDRFPGVVQIDHPGVNVAPWNVSNAPIVVKRGQLYVDKKPLICFHFQGLRRRSLCVYDVGLVLYGVRPTSMMIRQLYRPYVQRLTETTASVAANYGTLFRFSSTREIYSQDLLEIAPRTIHRTVGRILRRQYLVVWSRQAV